MADTRHDNKSNQKPEELSRQAGEQAVEQTRRIGMAAAKAGEDMSRASADLLSQNAEMLQNTQAADHFKNLFEMPVLFYALCGFLVVTHQTTLLLLACAWGYVFLRSVHAYIHLTGNKVIRRFQAYLASSIVLFVMWGVFAARLLMG